MSLTAPQKLKYAILELAYIWRGETIRKDMTGEEIEDEFDYLDGSDAINEIRTSGTETKLPRESSRHYESDEVAVQCPTGEWVGFTYWYGGGKHGEPEAIDWIPHAYDLTVVSKEVVRWEHTFTKVKP